MNPYLFTLVFLMLMSVLTSSEVVRFSQNCLGNQLHTHHHQSAMVSEEMKAFAALEDFRDKQSTQNKDKIIDEETPDCKSSSSVRRSTPLEFNFARPPNNARLNFYLLLHETPNKKYPLSPYEGAARLMRALYGEANVFAKIPNAEYRILDQLIELKEETRCFTYPDQLSTLQFADKELQDLFYLILKGFDSCPSLLNYITFDSKVNTHTKKLNLMFAAPIVLESLLNNPPLCNALLALRAKLWEEIIDQEEYRLERTADECKTRTNYTDELRQELKKLLASSGYKYENSFSRVFDLSLGKFGNILFIEDPKTGYIRREKCIVEK